ncbi:MAG: phosphoglycerate dehydrogenase [Thermodesulfobacteriota bacterium]|nr:phosphoglycerate dehydrogenase [Thermodesulfobacteriota bacterium]
MSPTLKVLVSDNISPEGKAILAETKGIEADVRAKVPPDELKAIIKNYHGLIVRSATKVTAEVIAAAENLRVIGRAGTGVDNIDLASASKRGIVVMNTPGGNTLSAAEHTLSLILALARHIPQATASIKAGKWEKDRFMGTEIGDRTLGIIGLGNIGAVVAQHAESMGMKTIGYDPFLAPEAAAKKKVELVALDDLFARSDFITLHTPLTPSTKNLLNASSFAKMKKGVRIINCARGGLIDEMALHEAIVSGKVAGAALDVFEKEPPGKNPLLELDQVICTPHLGASTTQAQVKVSIAIAEQVVEYLLQGTARHAVNLPSVSPEVLVLLNPYLLLAEKIGKFLAQITPGRMQEVHLTYSGSVLDMETPMIAMSLLKGLLEPILEEKVNFVNAPILAKERGIKIMESRSRESEDYTTLLAVQVQAEKVQNTVAGTLFGKNEPRIVRINEFVTEAVPEGNILFVHNQDKPGVIGNMGGTLASHGINIGQMHLSRDQIGGTAISLVHVDGPVSQEVLNALQRLPHILSAIQLEL